MKHQLKRRDFLTQLGLAAGAMTVGQFKIPAAFAQQAKRPILIHLSVSGGAHSLLGLNPLLLKDLYNRDLDPVPNKDSELYPAYNDEQLIKTPHHLLAEAAQPLAEHSQDIAIINGMMMLADSPLHETNEAFVNTGDDEGREEIFVSQMRRQFDPSIFGLARGSFRLGGVGGIPLSDLASASSMMSKAELLSQHGRQNKSGSNLERLKRDLVEINARFRKLEDVRQVLNQKDSSYEGQWQINLLSAISAGIVNYAFVDMASMSGGGLVDTHSNHDQQQKSSQRAIFTQVSNFIKKSKSIPDGSGSLYDRMVIMMTTEFARTSWAESRDGTGHNPHNNSALLSGGLIRTGQTLGQSTVIPSSRARVVPGSDGRSRLQALPFDFGSNQPLTYEEGLKFASSVLSREKKDGQHDVDYIFPANVMKTIALAMGLKPTGKLLRYKTLSTLLKEG